tara:strand:+ start:4378 stop:4986 length:609 start_codon:yes stop_codon:yes gene_type:complete
MINAILEGFFLGLVLAVLIGPVFFQMIDLSISKNKKTALIFAFGVWLSDITVLSLCVVLINQIEEWHLLESKILEYLAFVVFIIFGITKLLSKPSVSNTLQIKANKKILFSQGYLINTVNPSVWAFWLSTSTLAQELFNGSKFKITIYFLSCIITFISTDLIKIVLAYKLKNNINRKILFIFNKIVGILFIIAGVVILYETF